MRLDCLLIFATFLAFIEAIPRACYMDEALEENKKSPILTTTNNDWLLPVRFLAPSGKYIPLLRLFPGESARLACPGNGNFFRQFPGFIFLLVT